METSLEIKNIAKALGEFQAEVGKVAKDSTNPFFKSKYASLENVIETIREPLTKHGLSFAQFPQERGLTTILMHSSGEFIRAWAALVIKDETPQGQGSAITYMRRYALSAALGLATEDDDDGNAASPQSTAPKAVKPPTANATQKPEPASDKEAIKALLKKLGHEPATLAAARKVVAQLTNTEYVEQNYPLIIERLEALTNIK